MPGLNAPLAFLRLSPSVEKTIASGVIGVNGKEGHLTLDTESDAASDDLDSITGGTEGDLLLVRPASAARTVVLKHAIGANKIATPNGVAVSLAEATDSALLYFNGTQWEVLSVSVLGPAMWAGCPQSPAVLVHTLFDDFTALDTNWTVTEDDVACTQGVLDVQHGVVSLTNKATTDDNAQQITWAQETFKLTSGKRLWFETRVKLSSADASNVDLFIGLAEAEDLTGVVDNMPANGLGFRKDDGDAQIDCCSSDGGTDTSQANVGTLVADTWVKLGFYFDGGASGAGTVTPYVNDVAGTPITVTYATMAELAPMFMVRNGDATTQQILQGDYVKVVAER